MLKEDKDTERCAICGCKLVRAANTYAKPTVEGRSHATRHHFVAERFFGRSTNRRGTVKKGIFDTCPWGHENESELFCYECHEVMLHNPVLLPQDIAAFAELVRSRDLAEDAKPSDRKRIAGRVQLLHEVISRGVAELLAEEQT